MPQGNINGDLASHGHISGVLTIGSGGGTSDYELLENKPQINGHELIDNQTAHELGLASMQDVSDIESDIALLSQKLPKNYSTTEQNTGIKWIDGKNIYRCVYEVNMIVRHGTTWYSTGINISHISEFITSTIKQVNAIWNVLSPINDNGILKLVNLCNGDLTVNTIILEYTKNE